MSYFIWIIIAVALSVVEIFTAGFFVIFFALGALITAGVAFVTLDFSTQMGVFLVSSTLLVLFGRPFLKKTFNLTEQPLKATNIDKIKGETVLVLEPVTRYAGRVRVLHTGEVWTAYLTPDLEGETLEAGQEGQVIAVDGAKLVIQPLTSASTS